MKIFKKIISVFNVKIRGSGLKKEYFEIKESGFFDEEWYLEKNPDVKKSGMDPVLHYILYGSSEGRNPSSWFDAQYYLGLNPDVDDSKVNPLLHYLKNGRMAQKKDSSKDKTIGNIDFSVKQDAGASNGNLMHGLIRMGIPEYGPVSKIINFDSKERLGSEGVEGLSICVQLHFFHTDQANEIVSYLLNIDKKFTLLISVKEQEDVRKWEKFFLSNLSCLSSCIVKNCPNIGRDVFPWVVLFREEILAHDLFVHIHTKKSDYNSELNSGWGKFLFHNTLGSKGVVTQIYQYFVDDPKIGLVYPPYYGRLKKQPAWGACKEKMHVLAKRAGMEMQDGNCPNFPAGSFFWCRTDAMKPLLVTTGISQHDFDIEAGQIDGTLAHAIERFVGVLGNGNGFKSVCCAVDVAYNLGCYWSKKRFEKTGVNNSSRIVYPTLVGSAKGKKLKNLRIAVCVAVAGDFEELVRLPFVDFYVDYFCFTETSRVVKKPYINKIAQYVDINPRKTARFIKLHPHYHLPEYDVVVWMDANIIPLHGIVKYLDSFIESDADIAVIEHPVRNGYVEEAMECARIGADDTEIIQNQVDGYIDAGLANQYLLETNIIVSRPKREKVKDFFNIWWKEVNTKSIRDQISINYAISKSDVVVCNLFKKGISVHNHGEFLIFSHDLEDRDAVVSYCLGY